MEPDYYALPYIVTNVVAVFAAVSAMLWSTVSRALFSIIFIGAFAMNLFLAMMNPSAYLEFGEMSTNEFYRSVILGLFSSHVTLYVSLIAGCQLLIGVFISYKGKLMKIAMIGALLFLLAIAPLGYGAAFPSSLIMATGLVILLSRNIRYTVYEIIYPSSKTQTLLK